MAKIDLEKLNDVQHDVLKEIGNIGAGNAMTALASMINQKVDMKVPKVNLIGFSDLVAAVGNEEELMVSIMLSLEGDIDGMVLFMLDMESARILINLLLNNMGAESMKEEDTFTEMHFSALKEIGNIIIGAYMSALSNMTHLNISLSVPHIQIDMAGAILSIPAIQFGQIGDKVLCIENNFNEKSDINGYFFMVLELESYEVILESLGIS